VCIKYRHLCVAVVCVCVCVLRSLTTHQGDIIFILLLFQSTSESVIKRASMLSDIHFRNLRQKMLLKQRTEEAARRLEVTEQQ